MLHNYNNILCDECDRRITEAPVTSLSAGDFRIFCCDSCCNDYRNRALRADAAQPRFCFDVVL